MTTTDKIKELEKARAKVAQLEQAIAAELSGELAALPAKYGFNSVAAFVTAVTNASGKRRGRKPGKAKTEVASAAGATKRRRKRAVITDAMRAEVKKMVAAGKGGTEIAKAVKISLPSVQNVKKALGLVRKKR